MSTTKEIVENYDLKGWYDLLLRKEKYSFYKDLPFERLIKDVKGELDELLTGIQNNDYENIKEEIADVMFNTSQLIQALLSRDLITSEDFHNTATEQKKKIYKRQPFLKYNYEKPVDWEHETALFKKLKEQNANSHGMSGSMLKDNIDGQNK